jgi:hypothetical protein
MRRLFPVLLALLIPTLAQAAPQVLSVDGAKGEQALRAAVQNARAIRRKTPEAEIVLRLSGRFVLTAPLVLGPEDSGSAAHPFLIEAGTEGAVLTGSALLAPIASKGEIKTYQLPVSLQNTSFEQRRLHVRVAPPVAYALFDAEGPLSPSRLPQEGWLSPLPAQSGDSTSTYRFPPEIMARLRGAQDVWLQGYPGPEWSYESLGVASLSPEGIVTREPSHYERGKAPRLAFANVPDDAMPPGRFYRSGNGLIARPRGELRISTLPSLLRIEGASDIRLSRLTIEDATGDAVIIKDSRAIRLEESVVRNASSRGVVIEGGAGNAIVHALIENTGEGGVLLSGGDRASLTPSGHSVTASIFRAYNRLALTYKPAVALEGVGQNVTGNRFEASPHMALYLSGNDHRIRFNAFIGAVNDTSDAGGFYTGRDWTMRGTVIENNSFFDIGRKEAYTMGVYLDDMASGFSLRGNLFVRTPRGVFIGGGRDNEVIGNVFIASNPAIHLDQRGLSWGAKALRPGSELMQRLSALPVQGPLWATRYPRLASILSEKPAEARGNASARNLFWGVSEPYHFEDRARFEAVLSLPDRPAPAGEPPQAKRPADLKAYESALGLPLAAMDEAFSLTSPLTPGAQAARPRP